MSDPLDQDENTELVIPDAEIVFASLADWQLARIWWMLEENKLSYQKSFNDNCANYAKAQQVVWQAMLTYDDEDAEKVTLAHAKP